jgi:long-chain acyl-CoA synthetase
MGASRSQAQTLEERREILAEIEGLTVVDRFLATCDAHGGDPALVVEGAPTRTWADYRREAEQVASGLLALGVQRGDTIGLMLTNRPEHVIADVGALLAGAVPISAYQTLTAEQVRHIASDAGIRVAVVDDAELAERWLEIADAVGLRHLIVRSGAGDVDDPRVRSYEDLLETGRAAMDVDALERVWRSLTPDDPATIIYTSGTTGLPKGVVLTHRNLVYMLAAILRIVAIGPWQRRLSYLPLAHVAERAVTHYVSIGYGGTVYFVPDITRVGEVLPEARPHLFMAVPRVWEKLHAAVTARLDEEGRRGAIAKKAIDVASRVVRARMAGERVPALLRLRHKLLDRLVLAKIRHGLGLDELEIAVSGAAPISEDLLVFYQAIGLEIIEVYGMTETSAVITTDLPGATRIGSVGVPLAGVEVALAEDGEILARGPVVTPGYVNAPEATAEAIDADGWLYTGDLGYLDDDGYLTIVGRKKELIITAGGKNISPDLIETAIRERSRVIGQICAVGDGQPYIAALIALDPERLARWCDGRGIRIDSLSEAAEHPAVREEVQRAVDAGNARVSRAEQVKRWALVDVEWTVESGLLTPSMKLRRRAVHERHADEIASLYAT